MINRMASKPVTVLYENAVGLSLGANFTESFMMVGPET